jgi:hypothetical protein
MFNTELKGFDPVGLRPGGGSGAGTPLFHELLRSAK